MALDDPTSQERLTPEARRGLLRAFADRMLLKVTAMDDPQDLPGVERAVRTAAVIERIYSRCDRAEAHAPDPRKLEAERARNSVDAIHTRASLATAMKWGEQRRQALGPWWDAAKASAQNPAADPAATPIEMPAPTPAPVLARPHFISEQTTAPDAAPDLAAGEAMLDVPAPDNTPDNIYVDYTDQILKTRADLGLANTDLINIDPAPP